MHEIKTQKFTEDTISIRWFTDLDRKTITAWNLLTLLMSGRTEKYDTRQALSAAASHAYGMRAGYGLMGYGDRLMVEYRLSAIRPKLAGDAGYEDEVLEIMDQSLHHPLFRQEFLDEARYLLKNRLVSMMQDPDSRALSEALKAAGKGSRLEIQMQGYLEDLDDITLDDLQSLYDSLKTLPSQTLAVGDLSPKAAAWLEKHYPGQTLKSSWKALKAAQIPAEVVLEKEISQSSLVQVYETGILPQDPDYYTLLVLNSLLGSSSVSLLFEIIREKHSYCYSIASSLVRFDGALLISTATDRAHLEDVKRLIAKIIEDVKDEKFSDDTFETVKLELCDTLAGQKDSPAGMMEQEFLNEVLQRPITAGQIQEKIRAVTRQDVARAAGSMKLAASAELVQKEEQEAELDQDQDGAQPLIQADAKPEDKEGSE